MSESIYNEPFCTKCFLNILHQMFPQHFAPNVSSTFCTKCFLDILHQMFPPRFAPNVSSTFCTKCFLNILHQMFPQHFAPNVFSTFCSTLTDSTKHFPSGTDGQSTDQEIIHLIWFWNVHYCVYSSPALASWIFSTSSHIFKTYFSTLAAPTTVCNEDFFFWCFHIKILNVFFIFPSDLITLIVLYCIFI